MDSLMSVRLPAWIKFFCESASRLDQNRFVEKRSVSYAHEASKRGESVNETEFIVYDFAERVSLRTHEQEGRWSMYIGFWIQMGYRINTSLNEVKITDYRVEMEPRCGLYYYCCETKKQEP